MAIDIYESDLTQPCKLNLEIKELVRGILCLDCVADRIEKSLVQGIIWRGDVLQVEEDSAGVQ